MLHRTTVFCTVETLQRPIGLFNRVLGEIAEETLFSIPAGPTVKAVVKFMGEREIREEVGN